MLNWDDPRLARLERAGRAAWVWDVHGQRIVWATDEAARLWGVDDAFLLIDRPFGARDPSAEDLTLAASALAHTEGIDAEIRLWLTGRRRTINVMARRFARGPHGDLVLFTPRAKPASAEPASRAAPANPIADLLGSFPLGLAVFSSGGRCLYGNAAFERIFGAPGQISFAELMGSPRAGERLIRALLTAGTIRVSPTLTRDGAEMTLQIDAALIQDPVARLSAFLVQAQDVSARRGRERQLGERFDMLKQILESTVDGWAVLDRRLRLKSFGGALFDAIGVDATNAIGKPWREACALLRIDASAEIGAALGSRDAAQAVLAGEPRRLLTATPNWSEEGDFTGYQLIVSAARADHIAQDQAAPRAPQRVLDFGTVALIAHDNFDIVYANARAAKLFGAASADTLIGRPFLDLFPNDERHASQHYDALAGGAREQSSPGLEARGEDGQTLFVDGEFRFAKLSGKTVVLASFQDITRFMGAAAARPATTGMDTSWLEAAPAALLLLDNKGRITRANSQASALLRLGASEIVGRSFDEIIDKPDRTAYEIRRAAAASMAPGLSAMLEARLKPRADYSLTALVALRPAPPPAEPGFIIAITNLAAHEEKATELTRALGEAEDMARQKTDFLSAVSHEMRTPLNAIIGFSEFMKEGRLGPIGNEKYAGYIDDIHMSGQHLLSLVNDLLDMSKIEAGRYELDFTSVNVEAVIDQAMRILRPQAEKKAVTLIKTGESVPRVMADQRSLRQILLNLLSNAVKFTPGTGSVMIRTSHDPIEGVKIEVSDTGIGMTVPELAHALEPYRQIHHSHANDEPGTGLGLPLAKALTIANHALFSIESAPDKGTRATITFPAAQIAEGLAGEV